jgi:hypothetical protein
LRNQTVEHLAILDQDPRDGDPLLLTARQLVRPRPQLLDNTHAAEGPRGLARLAGMRQRKQSLDPRPASEVSREDVVDDPQPPDEIVPSSPTSSVNDAD